ncbi:MAG: glutamine-hydrolyzing carbamoyl-phosphate synthase small subunit [Rhodothalassiaceae bacterium]
MATACAAEPPAPEMTAVLVLEDGSVFWGQGLGATGQAVGEVCFNTAMTGYQEILTDPSYAGQIITFTFPHIGNVGVNGEDLEAPHPAARGFVLREPPTPPSNWRAEDDLARWAATEGLIGIAGIDTRRLTRRIRTGGAPRGAIAHCPDGQFDLAALLAAARDWPGLAGMELARTVSTNAPYGWSEGVWLPGRGYGSRDAGDVHVVVVDYGVKRNILRLFAETGARVTVVPADSDADAILALDPDGVFLSNGPGDPAATATYAVPVIRRLIAAGLPIFGICLGHQLLALALGGETEKMHQGHRGANHPVKDLATGAVAITSMNHGFTVRAESLAGKEVRVSQISLFDGSVCALEAAGGRLLSVQQHPEASPGPQDSSGLFQTFVDRLRGN